VHQRPLLGYERMGPYSASPPDQDATAQGVDLPASISRLYASFVRHFRPRVGHRCLAGYVHGTQAVKHGMQVAVATLIAFAARSWALFRRLVTLFPRRSTRPDRHREARRSYVFGAISRQTFEAAMRKTRWSSSPGRRRETK
jgi:hypothetical protein